MADRKLDLTSQETSVRHEDAHSKTKIYLEDAHLNTKIYLENHQDYQSMRIRYQRPVSYDALFKEWKIIFPNMGIQDFQAMEEHYLIYNVLVGIYGHNRVRKTQEKYTVLNHKKKHSCDDDVRLEHRLKKVGDASGWVTIDTEALMQDNVDWEFMTGWFYRKEYETRRSLACKKNITCNGLYEAMKYDDSKDFEADETYFIQDDGCKNHMSNNQKAPCTMTMRIGSEMLGPTQAGPMKVISHIRKCGNNTKH